MMIRAFKIFILLHLFTNVTFSQTPLENYQKYFNSGDYINAKKEIEAALLDSNNSKNAKVWLNRSEVNSILYSNNPSENPDCIEIAYMSITKASFLDTKKEYSKEIISQLNFISQLYYNKGTLYTKLKQDNYAMQSFQKAIDINPNNYDAAYNLGIMLYNSSINHIKIADSFLNSNQEKYNNEKEIYLTEIKKSAPLLEKALEHDNTNKNTMNCLLDIYKRLQRKEQYDKLKILLSSTK